MHNRLPDSLWHIGYAKKEEDACVQKYRFIQKNAKKPVRVLQIEIRLIICESI